MTVYNNDFGTFFVFFLIMFPSLLCGKFGKYYAVLVCTLFYNNIEQFRWFQTEHIRRTITIDQIYTHDTRETYNFINWDDDGIDVNNVHTGSLKYYLSTVGDCIKYCSNPKEIFTIDNRIYPYIKGHYKQGDSLDVYVWRYTSSPLYEIIEVI